MDIDTVPVLLAFAAGVASFLSPCHLAVVPAYLAFLGGNAVQGTAPATRRQLLQGAALFVLGFSLAMVALGLSVGLVGYALWDQLPWLRKAGGVVLLVLGLHVLGLLRLRPLYRQIGWDPFGPTARRRPWDGLILGTVFGFGWTPCVGPVLAAILLLAADHATASAGGLLLAVYAAGLSVPFLVVAALIGQAPRLLVRLRRSSRAVEWATGVMLLAMGVVLYTNQLQRVAAMLGTWTPL